MEGSRRPARPWSQFWSNSPASVTAAHGTWSWIRARISVWCPPSNGPEQNSKAGGVVEALSVLMPEVVQHLVQHLPAIRGHSGSLAVTRPPSRPAPELAKPQVRSAVTCGFGVARGGVEPPTFRFSVGRSYQLSYLAAPSSGAGQTSRRTAPASRDYTGAARAAPTRLRPHRRDTGVPSARASRHTGGSG